MEKEEVFTEIKELQLKGGGALSISKEGVLEGDFKAVKEGNILKIEGSQDLNQNIVINSDGGCIIQGNHMSNVSTISMSGTGSNIVYINGKRVDLDKLESISQEKPADLPKVRYRLEPCKIEKIKISGSFSIQKCPAKLLDKNFSGVVKGSGELILPKKHFHILNLSVTGSGDIIGSETTSCDIGIFNLCGSGDIKKILVKESCTANLTGSGDIKVNVLKSTNVNKNKVGSGTLKVNIV